MFILDILKNKYWRRLACFEHPDIKKAIKLLPDIVASSRQANTIKAYISTYRQFEKWAGDKEELSIYPSNELAITIYILSLIQAGKSISSIHQFVFAAAWIHSVGGHRNPTTGLMVKTVVEGARRTSSIKTTRKKPFTPSIIRRIRKHSKKENKTKDLESCRLLAFVLLCFAGFFRCQEALSLKRSDIAFHASYMAIFLEHSKTDTYRNGRTVLIARARGSLDPVAHLYKYLRLANIPDNSQMFIFRQITKRKNGDQYLRNTNKAITYSTMRTAIKSVLNDIGLPAKEYSTHSLRAGGATAAAKNGVPDRLFKVHGRWKSEDSKNRYVEESIHNKLKVTLNLGL